ncbi:MAG: hypothetical protein ABEK50_13220 [bacterium]
MTSVANPTITTDTTVGELVDLSPTALMDLLKYQTGSAGICVIGRDDTISDLSDRFDVNQQSLLRDLRTSDL